MAQSFTDPATGQNIVVPGTYVSTQVVSNVAGAALSGIVTIVGEAEQGPDYTLEANLDLNSFGPQQLAQVVAKYGSGRIVDGYRAVINASNDPNIQGSVTAVKLVKTNVSTAAASTITRSGFGAYGAITAIMRGFPGNTISYQVAIAQQEVAPEIGPFTYCPHYLASPVSFSLRANGLASESVSVSSLTTGTALCSTIENYTNGIAATGGTLVDTVFGNTGTNISLTVNTPTTVTITLAGAFGNPPSPGDCIAIPIIGDFGASTASVLIGGSNANRATYLVTSVTNGGGSSSFTATVINQPTGAPSLANISPTPVSAGALDVVAFKPVTISNETGMDRQSEVGMTGTFSWTTSGPQVVVTAPSAWTAQPKAGDLAVVPTAVSTLTAGFYQVTSSTSTTATMSRFSNGSAGSSGSQAFGSPITQGTQPIFFKKPTIDGLGKTLEVIGTPGSIFVNSTTGAALPIANTTTDSADEQQVSTTISQGAISASFSAGGEIPLSIGCSQASATVVIGATSMTFKVGATTIFTAPYSTFTNLSTMASFINSQPTFTATLLLPQYAGLAPSRLDEGTFGISSTTGGQPGRIKHDSDAWVSNTDASTIAEATDSQAAPSGLPEAVTPATFLTGGIRGGSSTAQFAGGIDACQGVTTNFIGGLISANASQDITGVTDPTDPSSTYTIDSVNAYLNAHAIAMSALLVGQNRIAFGGKSGTFSQQLAAAQQLSSFRMLLAFQDVLALTASSGVAQFQPWLGACTAIGMQAAAGFKGIVHKRANVSGVISAAGDFNPKMYAQVQQALQAGLLVLQPITTGGFWWVSDQTTYNADSNFVYNSLQAVYISDLMVLTLIQNFNSAIVGQSVAQISAVAAESFFTGQLYNFLRLNWTAPSQALNGQPAAPLGYSNPNVQISGGVLTCSAQLYLAGLLYFIPINLSIAPVQQAAS